MGDVEEGLAAFRPGGRTAPFAGEPAVAERADAFPERMDVLGAMFSAYLCKKTGCLGLPLDPISVGQEHVLHRSAAESGTEHRI